MPRATRRKLPGVNPTLVAIFRAALLLSLFAAYPNQRFAFAQRGGKATQFDVEAVYLYQFGRFVIWPAQTPVSPDYFSICVLGRDPFGAKLESTVAGERINQLPLTVSRIADVSLAKGCRILYVSSSEDARLPTILSALQNAPILTVGDSAEFVSHGGMIQFVTDENRIRFEINAAAVQRAGLTMSSELLKVASQVHGAPGAGANP
jgi:hypothetical protein